MGLSKTYGGATTLIMQGFNDMDPWGYPGESASSTLAEVLQHPGKAQTQHHGGTKCSAGVAL